MFRALGIIARFMGHERGTEAPIFEILRPASILWAQVPQLAVAGSAANDGQLPLEAIPNGSTPIYPFPRR